jgi:hypothetical protein
MDSVDECEITEKYHIQKRMKTAGGTLVKEYT